MLSLVWELLPFGWSVGVLVFEKPAGRGCSTTHSLSGCLSLGAAGANPFAAMFGGGANPAGAGAGATPFDPRAFEQMMGGMFGGGANGGRCGGFGGRHGGRWGGRRGKKGQVFFLSVQRRFASSQVRTEAHLITGY